MKVPIAAEKYHVPPTTLYDHVKGSINKIGAGAPTVLTEGEEEIVDSPGLARNRLRTYKGAHWCG